MHLSHATRTSLQHVTVLSPSAKPSHLSYPPFGEASQGSTYIISLSNVHTEPTSTRSADYPDPAVFPFAWGTPRSPGWLPSSSLPFAGSPSFLLSFELTRASTPHPHPLSSLSPAVCGFSNSSPSRTPSGHLLSPGLCFSLDAFLPLMNSSASRL